MDTSSIIENKETTKEYWKRRMLAEQGLLINESGLVNYDVSNQMPAAKLLLNGVSGGQVPADANCGFKPATNGNGKLGSDGESEASPESSLSPVDHVDCSLEGKCTGLSRARERLKVFTNRSVKRNSGKV